MGRVQDKIALITGAGSGLGRAAAELLAREGATVVATDLNEEGGRETVARIEADGGKALFQHQDVTQEAEWIALIDMIVDRFGRLDILVNNAGIIIVKPIEQLTLEDFRKQNAINVDGVFLGMKYGIAAMRKAGKGSIVNMSSVAGLVGSAFAVGYCASKGAVKLMTQAAAKEMLGYKTGVRVNSVHPGMIATPMADSIADQTGGKDRLDHIIKGLHGRYGTADEVAQLVLYLASDESSFCNGSAMVLDGGQTA